MCKGTSSRPAATQDALLSEGAAPGATSVKRGARGGDSAPSGSEAPSFSPSLCALGEGLAFALSQMANRRKPLQVALLVIGIAALFLYPLMILWPAGFAWSPRQSEYEQMMVGIYGTLGVFLIWASRKPEAHLSLIWFTVWSSVVHGGIMAVQAIVYPNEHEHLIGDVPFLLVAAIVLAVLTPRGVTKGAMNLGESRKADTAKRAA